MAKYDLKQKALELRKLGQSYGQIKGQINVSKSSLSMWLRQYPLTREQIRQIRNLSEIRIEKFRQTMLAKREKRFSLAYEEGKQTYLPLSNKELFIAGAFLYWGEGLKDLKYPFAIYNTNPQMIKFALLWYTKILHVPKEKIKIQLHLYSDMKIKDEIKFWQTELGIPQSQFGNPYIKKTSKANINHKGVFGHGTCGIIINDVRLKEKVMSALQAMADYYTKRI